METKLSIISFEDQQASTDSSTQNYSLTNSLQAPPPSLSMKYPFLAKGILFGLCLKGSTILRIDHKEYTIYSNFVFTILPNQIFESLGKSEDNFVECLFFSLDFVNNLPLPKDFEIFNNITNNPCLSISQEDMNELMEYHSFIIKARNRNRHIHNENVAKSLMHSFIALIASLYVAKTDRELKLNSRGTTIVEEFSKLLTKYHKTERKASFYSDKLCISTQYLSRTLKEITGRSVNTWITDTVILEAKALLKSSNMSILQISEELNFSNPSFFIRYFKQYAGVTPLKYREM